jgi:D-lyxose ketol-isomerase
MFYYFYIKDFLPWTYFDHTNKLVYKENVLKSKEKFDILNYGRKDFTEISLIYQEIKTLNKREKPNYLLYKKILKEVANKSTNYDNNNFIFKCQFQFS